MQHINRIYEPNCPSYTFDVLQNWCQENYGTNLFEENLFLNESFIMTNLFRRVIVYKNEKY